MTKYLYKEAMAFFKAKSIGVKIYEHNSLVEQYGTSFKLIQK